MIPVTSTYLLYTANNPFDVVIVFSLTIMPNRYVGSVDRAFASHVGGRGSNPGRDRPASLKQVVTAPLTCMRVTGTYCVTIGVKS